MSVQISLQDYALSFFGCILRSTIARSYGNSIFYFLSNCHIASHSGYIIYIPTSSVQGFQFFHVLANTFLSILRIAIQMDVRWYVTMVLVCIFLIISDTERLFIFFFFLPFVYLLWR